MERLQWPDMTMTWIAAIYDGGDNYNEIDSNPCAYREIMVDKALTQTAKG